MKGSKREQRRLEAAEHVCRCFRAAVAYYATQGHYMNMGLDWLLVWMDNAPKAVKYADPTPRKRKREATA